VQQEGLLQKYWMLWVPVQTLTFGVVPQHLRIVFIAAVSFVWLMILSSISSTQKE
jgi:protein Mpv17